VPLGTLAANLLGGFLVGVAVATFNRHPGLPPEARLMIVTGFMGGLTTFSTFSSEVVGLIGNGRYLWAAGAASIHLFGSLLLTGAGIRRRGQPCHERLPLLPCRGCRARQCTGLRLLRQVPGQRRAPAGAAAPPRGRLVRCHARGAR
jgi:protein CrcB